MWLLSGELSAQTPSKTNPLPTNAVAARYGCVPADIKLETIVEIKQRRSTTGLSISNETVLQRLNKLNARCKAGKLIDRKGKQIRFYKLQNCWGNPPADYLEILETERNTLRLLNKKFTVIEITCNQSGIAPL